MESHLLNNLTSQPIGSISQDIDWILIQYHDISINIVWNIVISRHQHNLGVGYQHDIDMISQPIVQTTYYKHEAEYYQ